MLAQRDPLDPETGADGSDLPHWPIARMRGGSWGTHSGAVTRRRGEADAIGQAPDLTRHESDNERGSDRRSMWLMWLRSPVPDELIKLNWDRWTVEMPSRGKRLLRRKMFEETNKNCCSWLL